MWFHSNNFNVGLHSDIYRLISFKLSMMIEMTECYILMAVWVTLTFIHGHIGMRNQKLVISFFFFFFFQFSLLFQLFCLGSFIIYFAHLIFKGKDSSNMIL